MHPMLNIAVKAARRAGQIINRASLDLDRIQVSKKQHNDFVTEVDKASEAAIIETLTTAYPKHSILAEESGVQDKDSEFQWIIDPLDGTTNFIHGFQYYCVSIALAHKGIITQAVVYDPDPQRPVHRLARQRRLPERAPHSRGQAGPARRRADRHGLPVPRRRGPRSVLQAFLADDRSLRRPAPSGRGRARSGERGRGPARWFLRARHQRVGRGRGQLADHGSGRTGR